MGKHKITPELIREILDYDPETGVLTWRARGVHLFAHCQKPSHACNAWNARYAGKPALTNPSGRKRNYLNGPISFGGEGYVFKAHRVAFAHYHGKWPNNQVDHIEAATGHPYDNRIKNLRDVTGSENNKNMQRAENNTSGTTGVYLHKASGRHAAYINVNRKRINLGYFDLEQDAISARKAAELKYGFHKNHGRKAVA